MQSNIGRALWGCVLALLLSACAAKRVSDSAGSNFVNLVSENTDLSINLSSRYKFIGTSSNTKGRNDLKSYIFSTNDQGYLDEGIIIVVGKSKSGVTFDVGKNFFSESYKKKHMISVVNGNLNKNFEILLVIINANTDGGYVEKYLSELGLRFPKYSIGVYAGMYIDNKTWITIEYIKKTHAQLEEWMHRSTWTDEMIQFAVDMEKEFFRSITINERNVELRDQKNANSDNANETYLPQEIEDSLQKFSTSQNDKKVAVAEDLLRIIGGKTYLKNGVDIRFLPCMYIVIESFYSKDYLKSLSYTNMFEANPQWIAGKKELLGFAEYIRMLKALSLLETNQPGLARRAFSELAVSNGKVEYPADVISLLREFDPSMSKSVPIPKGMPIMLYGLCQDVNSKSQSSTRREAHARMIINAAGYVLIPDDCVASARNIIGHTP